ncbi:MAG TPA: hypothetical protein VF773_19035 [Verrucomicrobiae bacterium]
MKHLLKLLALTVTAAFCFSTEPKESSPGAKPVADPPGIHNLYLLGTNVYSGSTPENESAFEALAKLGIKTLISVDGAQPNVAAAKKFGLRYIHLPHGYDGISTNLQLTLAKASTELPQPIYVHCHHGKHRGPTAAALLCITKDNWSAEQAEQWLHAAGTSTNYPALYQTVRQFKRPSAHQLSAHPSHFPETARVSGLVDAMVAIDETWENLKSIRAAGYETPKNNPDLKPANQAVILWEHYRESQRLADSAQRGTNFLALLRKAEAEAKTAEELLRQHVTEATSELRPHLEAAFDSISKTCTSCHRQFRDN